MRIRNILVFTAAIAFLTNSALANSNDKVSISLIADKASGLDKSPLVSLLEVELSQKEGIQLLERAAIDKIMQEQQLNAAGLTDRNTAIKIGKLLRANAFIILSLENQTKDANDLIRVRVSETAHGLRLADFFEQSESTNPKEAVERIIKKLEAILKKINQPDEKLIPIGIVDIHRVQLGEQYKMLERTLPVMLSVRLSLEPQIIMLEREDLKILLDEKLRTEGQDSKFWNSAILIDGYLQPNSGQLEMHLNLKQAAGDNIKSLTVPVEPNEPANAIAKASTEIIQQLQNSPPAIKWQPELEAEEFYKKGKMLEAHSRHEESMNLFETAQALQPNNIFYTESLFTNEWTSRRYNRGVLLRTDNNNTIYHYTNNWSPFYTDYELAELVSVFIRKIYDCYKQGTLSAYDVYNKYSRQIGIDILSMEGYFESFDSVSSEQVKEINRENRKIWIELLDKILQRQLINTDRPQVNDIIKTRLVWISTDDPNELIRNLKIVITEYVLPPKFGGQIESIQEREEILVQVLIAVLRTIYSNDIVRTHLKDVRKELQELLRQYIYELIDGDYEIVSSKLQTAISDETFRVFYQFDESRATKTIEGRLKIVQDLIKQLMNPSEPPDKETKQKIVSQLQNMVGPRGVVRDLNERFLILQKICNFFIENKDIDGIIALLTRVYFLPSEHSQLEIHSWLYQVYEQGNEILQQYNSDVQVNAALRHIAIIRGNLGILPPQLNTNQADKIKVNMLLDREKWPTKINLSSWQYQEIIQDNILWIVFYGRQVFDISDIISSSNMDLLKNIKDTISISLVGIDLKENMVTALWQTEIVDSAKSYLFYNSASLVICKDISYIYIPNMGIIELPGSISKGLEFLKNPKLLTKDHGLPSLYITSMAKDDTDNIWIAYGAEGQESGLSLYNPKTEKWQTVFCSTLKGEPPFNSGYPYQIEDMRFTQSGQLVFKLNNPRGKIPELEKWIGTWEMNTNNNKPDRITPNTRLPYYGSQINIPLKDNVFDNLHNVNKIILDGKPVLKFVSTPYGLIGIGEGVVGFIETENMEK